MTAPPGEPSMVPAAARPASRLSGSTIAVAAAVMLVAAAGALRLADHSLGSAADQVSAQELAQRAAVTRTLPAVKLRTVAPSERDGAIAAMALPQSDANALAADLAANRVRLVWMTFFDSDAEDGDVVTVSSGGFARTVPLLKAPTAVALPAPADGFVRVTGAVDGRGGGVTVGIVTGSGATALAVLSVGQTISIPVAAE